METKVIGNLGWFSEDQPLSSLEDYKGNVIALGKVFSGLSPINSYSLAVTIYQTNARIVKTVDSHYLVNNTTDPKEIMTQVYNRISLLSLRYKFEVEDKIICKLKPLSIKVKDPKFLG